MIKFGTDGWRGKIADDFTFSNLRLVSQALANFIKKTGESDRGLVVGYDNRFLSKEYAEEAAKVISGNGIPVSISSGSLPSPVLSYAVKLKGAKAGVMITASHNPPEYNGFKVKAEYAGSASKEITGQIEEELKGLSSSDVKAVSSKLKIRTENFKGQYIQSIEKIIDLQKIKGSNIKVVFDPMHGSSIGYLNDILKSIGIEVMEVNGNADPLFGGTPPEPLPKNLEELTSATKELSLKFPDDIVVGLALDGDGDRISAVDSKGTFINPHNVFSILLKHLIENKKWTGEVVKTFNITKMIDKLCSKYGLKVHETPIGFKYICELMLKNDILIGGEESGGVGVKNHIPERDGTLCALLLLECQAMLKKDLHQIMTELYNEFGQYAYDRNDIHIKLGLGPKIISALKSETPKGFSGKKIREVLDLDGVKLVMEDDSWILFRPSGTEPLLRIYAEGKSSNEVEAMLAEGEKLISGIS